MIALALTQASFMTKQHVATMLHGMLQSKGGVTFYFRGGAKKKNPSRTFQL